MKKDKFRTEKLEAHDLTVIRFDNSEINNKFEEACEYIDFVVTTAISNNK
jgi:very-short-patch-repair endonuclease